MAKAKKRRPVKGWAKLPLDPTPHGTFSIYNNDDGKPLTEVHIAPTATHAVVELAKVEELIEESRGDRGVWGVAVIRALQHLSLTPSANRKKRR